MVTLRNCSLIAAGFVILLANGISNPVYAQYSGASKKSFELEEVVVTARKRTESLSDIPEAITAFSGLDIDNIGITRIKDVADLTPNMILQPSYRLGVVNLSSRGIATPQQGDSPVVINFDGVQAPAQDFINQDLFDIERIEVLKGPQGALYGAGATAGAINIVTKQPSNEFAGFARAKIGNADAYRLVGGLSGPIVEDQLYFRLAGVYQDRDGYIKNSLTGDSLDFLDEIVIRGAISADLDNLRVDVKASYTDTEAGASYYESLPLLPDPVQQIDLLFGGPLGRLGSDTSQGTFKNHSNQQTEEQREVVTLSVKAEYEFGGGVFTSVTGYNNSEQSDYGDLDFQPADVLIQDVRFDVEVFNQELRFASDPDARFRWVGGLFYQNREIYNQVVVLLGDFTVGHKTLKESRNNPLNVVLTDGKDTIDSDAWGVFLSTNYDLTEDLVLTAAIRYDKVSIDTAYVGGAMGLLSLPDASASRSFDKWQPKLNLAYNVSDDILLYIDAARGFRSGVPNPTAAFAGGLPRFIEPEIADTVELGVKSKWFDNRLQFNAALFYTDIENRHHYFYGAALQSMTTYDEAEVKGMEIEIAAILTEGLRLTANYGLMSAEITSDEIAEYYDFTTGEIALAVSNKGNTLPDTPQYTFNAALTYETPLVTGINLYGYAGYKLVDKIYFDTENQIDTGSSKNNVDLRLGLQTEKWDIVGYINNVTDERTYSNYAYSGGQGNYLPNEPRTYGVELSYRF